MEEGNSGEIVYVYAVFSGPDISVTSVFFTELCSFPAPSPAIPPNRLPLEEARTVRAKGTLTDDACLTSTLFLQSMNRAQTLDRGHFLVSGREYPLKLQP